MGKALMATYDSGGLYVKDAMLLLPRGNGIDLHFILALLNSKLLNDFYGEFFATIDVMKNAILALPIKVPSGAKERAIYEEIVKLAKRLLQLAAERHDLSTPAAVRNLEKGFAALDQRMEAQVRLLYGLAPNEAAT